MYLHMNIYINTLDCIVIFLSLVSPSQKNFKVTALERHMCTFNYTFHNYYNSKMLEAT